MERHTTNTSHEIMSNLFAKTPACRFPMPAPECHNSEFTPLPDEVLLVTGGITGSGAEQRASLVLLQ
ncbi:MAG: hypothetical protein SPI30_06900 [Prevotella sp.]|nr:hypothetical protein [Prevotella sp.]